MSLYDLFGVPRANSKVVDGMLQVPWVKPNAVPPHNTPQSVKTFYVSQATIKHAVSDDITQGFVSEPRRIDPETVSTEAPNVFKRLGTDTYVLMYDVYGARPNNMGFSETTDFVTYRDIGHVNEGVMKGTNFERPKHGAVTHLTLDELNTVAAHWNADIPLD